MKKAVPLVLLVALGSGCAATHAATHVLGLKVTAPVLSAETHWEARSAQEPNVWKQNGRWQMLFSAGWNRMAVGHATAPTINGPWTQDPEPVLGLGHGGWNGAAHEPSLLIDKGQIYVYFSPTTVPGTLRACDLMVATGRDVKHLRVLAKPALRPFDAARGIVNVSVVRDGDRYRMLFESRVTSSATWEIGYAVGSAPTSFRPVMFPLPSLQRGQGAYGGPDLHRTAHGWTVFYHAATTDTTLPTDIYRATSTNLVTWTQGPMVVRHPSGSDQVADPFLVDGRLFYAVMNNPRQVGSVYASHTSITAGP